MPKSTVRLRRIATPAPAPGAFEIVELTPEIAGDWLALNTRNRPKKDQKVSLYARDMSNGRWRFTGEPIKFDNTGRMIDGQNRCYAVIESGVTITVAVVSGLEPEAQEVMDSNAVRSSRDALAMNGYGHAKDLAATVLVHKLWHEGVYDHCMSHTPGYARPTNAEVVDYVKKHPGLVDAVALSSNIKRRLPLAIGAIATAYDALIDIDADDADDFFTRISELHTHGKGDPIATLLKRVQEMSDNRSRKWPSTSLFLIIRAWNAYRAGTPLLKFQFGSQTRGWASIPTPK